MRKIACQCCKPRWDGRIIEGASWIIFDRVFICETCRLAAIEYWRNVLGFSLAHHHPFIDELIAVESEK